MLKIQHASTNARVQKVQYQELEMMEQQQSSFSSHAKFHLDFDPIGAEHSIIVVALKFLAYDLDSRLRWVRHLRKNNLKFCTRGVPYQKVGALQTGVQGSTPSRQTQLVASCTEQAPRAHLHRSWKKSDRTGVTRRVLECHT